MRILTGLCAGALWLQAQAPDPSGGLAAAPGILTHIRSQMLQNLARQPNYTCVETVKRSRRSGSGRMQLEDTLRLEVALVNGNEMFAWPGSRKFEETDLGKLVPGGIVANGNFALHARAIFAGEGVIFQYRGASPLGGKRAVRFDYTVPMQLSGYQIRSSSGEATVGFHGSIYADPDSLDVRRIEVIAENIPRGFGLRQVRDAVDYERIPIGGAEFLLPVRSTLVMTDVHGVENRNEVRFAGCRSFMGESTLTFGEPSPDSAVIPLEIRELRIPVNLDVAFALSEELDVDTAAVGDPVRAQLQQDLRNRTELLFPKGSIASGRVTRMERRPDSMTVGMEFTEMTSANAHATLDLKHQYIAFQKQWAPRRRVDLETPPRSGESVIHLRPGMRRLPRILIYWKT